MRFFVVVFLQIFLVFPSLSAQIMLDHTYEGAANTEAGAYAEFSITRLEISGCKYVHLDKATNNIHFFNLDHTPFRSVNFDVLPFRGVDEYQLLFPTETLFDTDRLIEFMLTGQDSSGQIRTMVVNEVGLILLDEPGGLVPVTRKDMMRPGPIYNTGKGSRLVLDYDDGKARVFELPGLYVSPDCAASLTEMTVMPGTKSVVYRADTVYLSGVRTVMVRDTLILTESEYKEVLEEASKPRPIEELNPSDLRVGLQIQLKKLQFERGTATFIKGSTPDLKSLLKLMESYPRMEIRLEGHTDQRMDNMSSVDNNMQLSQRRVAAVKNYLVKKGINGDRIESIGYGGSRPIASNNQEETRKLNRRVEVKITAL
ncbi:MAG: OmpA family protein [Bacteroidota bacterium]